MVQAIGFSLFVSQYTLDILKVKLLALLIRVVSDMFFFGFEVDNYF